MFPSPDRTFTSDSQQVAQNLASTGQNRVKTGLGAGQSPSWQYCHPRPAGGRPARHRAGRRAAGIKTTEIAGFEGLIVNIPALRGCHRER
jgi:hypothetical protein